MNATRSLQTTEINKGAGATILLQSDADEKSRATDEKYTKKKKKRFHTKLPSIRGIITLEINNNLYTHLTE